LSSETRSENEELLYCVADNVARITLNAPDKLNSLSFAMLESITASIARAHEDGARCIVLTGTDRAFCTGARLDPALATDDDLGNVIAQYYDPMARAMRDSDIPIVTSLNGIAAGAGLGLALSADIVIAAHSAQLLCAFARIGLVPDAGTTWLLAQSVGRAKALEMAMLAEEVTAEEAQRMGLVARVVDDAALEAETAKLAGKLAAMPTSALGMIRKQVRQALDEDFEGALAAERSHQTVAGRTYDFREGVMAFLQKRLPNFKGE